MNANDNAVAPAWWAIIASLLITLCGIVGALLDLAFGLVIIFAACFSLYAACFALFTGQGWPPAVRAFSEPATQALIMLGVALCTLKRWAKTGKRRQ